MKKTTDFTDKEDYELIDIRIDSAYSRGKKLLVNSKEDNTEKAFIADLKYFWAWANVSFRMTEMYPVPIEIIYSFVSAHINGLDDDVDKSLVSSEHKNNPLGLSHKLSTIQRRLSSLGKKHSQVCKGLSKKYVYHHSVIELLKAARKIPENKVKQKDAITLDVLKTLIEYINTDTKRGKLLIAVLSVGFASGGRRRSELTSLRIENIKYIKDDQRPEGFYYLITLQKTKTHNASESISEVPVMGMAAIYLSDWLEIVNSSEGFVFRSINRHDQLGKSLSPEWIRKAIKALQEKAAVDNPDIGALDLSPHSLRSGFVTQCALSNVPAVEGMKLTLHRSEANFNKYYRAGEVVNNRAANFLD